MTTEEKLAILGELRSDFCFCGKSKTNRESFCKSCYFTLKEAGLSRALFRQWGHGYVEAYKAARDYLAGRQLETAEAI